MSIQNRFKRTPPLRVITCSILILLTGQAHALGAPVATFSTDSTTVTELSFDVDLSFSAPVKDLQKHELKVENGHPTSFEGEGATYRFTVFPTYAGKVTISLPAGVAVDASEGKQSNLASAPLVVNYQPPITTDLYGPLESEESSWHVYITFPQKVSGLTDSDLAVVNGTASGTISTSAETHDTHQTALEGRYYRTTITASKPGMVEVSLPAGAVQAVAGNQESSLVSNTLRTECTSDFGEKWIVDSAEDWSEHTASSSHLQFSDGFAEPTADTAAFSSTVKTFSEKLQPRSVTFTQSPVWNHWRDAGNIGPRGGAPILLPIANDDYYFIGGKNVHHSTDMKNWELVLSFPKEYSKWTTTAEYKDGTFYFFSDKPNDEDSQLFIGEKSEGGLSGEVAGLVFVAPSYGSDNSLLRDDTDGRFHVIYEEHSPLNAGKHSWDSPLAGHASSPDLVSGFSHHMHQPPVDHRTEPTGEIVYHQHPHHDYDHPYQKHEPGQDAYGDWTTIKIGQRYYLFGDYDQHGQKEMSVARFTSTSLYEEFELVGSFGAGHPDPTVGFAEGQFYLITQQKSDFVSPGPWVEGVEARAGVDSNGDGSIDQWTEWQTVKETYDHKPGYARVVAMEPAQIVLSGLPAGKGFQFEFRINNQIVPEWPPIMDRVEFAFEPGTSN
ncbi:MAG: hypothetical protein AAFY98_04860 [Verrucomicrobiota bacterium]